ncbi:MAG TPA: hypothetical protein VGO68_16060 [Pyrinomonadaceae bacterium]|jgi:hypothetical protein|nr:hypothetical protein [Pyrinomonadaceae bacterium]
MSETTAVAAQPVPELTTRSIIVGRTDQVIVWDRGRPARNEREARK